MIPLSDIKTHLRIEHDEDDTYLTTLASAAIAQCEQMLNRKLYENSVPDDDSNGLVMGDDIKIAALLIIGHLYENRSDTTDKQQYETPMASKHLLNPYRIIPV
ncbi:head-tail connector protein [Sansalvadorimonas verongulae]|uniref:head-tail connector protein n=1 Tax=Sansalvadorimonas verongulae TaxID=2172824 RepID=UPI001E29C875|nr:head-tail connector protein [Sansalvadorimonas verongulae]